MACGARPRFLVLRLHVLLAGGQPIYREILYAKQINGVLHGLVQLMRRFLLDRGTRIRRSTTRALLSRHRIRGTVLIVQVNVQRFLSIEKLATVLATEFVIQVLVPYRRSTRYGRLRRQLTFAVLVLVLVLVRLLVDAGHQR